MQANLKALRLFGHPWPYQNRPVMNSLFLTLGHNGLHSSKSKQKLNKVITCGRKRFGLRRTQSFEKGFRGPKPRQVYKSTVQVVPEFKEPHKHSSLVYSSKFKTAPPQLQGLREARRQARLPQPCPASVREAASGGLCLVSLWVCRERPLPEDRCVSTASATNWN